jgi:hypothetical protein
VTVLVGYIVPVLSHRAHTPLFCSPSSCFCHLRDITLFVESFLYFLQHQMVVFEMSPEDVLTFDVEDSDTMQSSIALSCSNTTDNSLVLFAVSSNPPLRYSITPDTGFLLTSEPCVMSVTLSNSELGLVRFLSTVPGDYFVSDHIAVVADILTGSDASDFANLPATEQPDAIRQYFLTHSGTFG